LRSRASPILSLIASPCSASPRCPHADHLSAGISSPETAAIAPLQPPVVAAQGRGRRHEDHPRDHQERPYLVVTFAVTGAPPSITSKPESSSYCCCWYESYVFQYTARKQCDTLNHLQPITCSHRSQTDQIRSFSFALAHGISSKFHIN
jgi:hypothetical protein